MYIDSTVQTKVFTGIYGLLGVQKKFLTVHFLLLTLYFRNFSKQFPSEVQNQNISTAVKTKGFLGYDGYKVFLNVFFSWLRHNFTNVSKIRNPAVPNVSILTQLCRSKAFLDCLGPKKKVPKGALLIANTIVFVPSSTTKLRYIN